MVVYLLFYVYLFYLVCVVVFFFFKQKTAYEMRISDWSSDVCSSDLRPRSGWARCIPSYPDGSCNHNRQPEFGSALPSKRRHELPIGFVHRAEFRSVEPKQARWWPRSIS